MIFDDSTLVTRTRGKHDDTHLPIFPVGWFLDDILFDPRFHVCRNVLPHERHPRLRVRLSGQDNDTKCWRRRGVYFDRRKNPTIMPSTGLRIAHFEPFSFSVSLSLSLYRLLSLPPLLPLPPLILAIRQQHHLHHSAWNYSFTASLILLFVIFLYFDLDSTPLLVGSFVVSQEIRRSEKYEYVRTKFSWRKIFITIFVSFSTWQRSLINYVNQRPFKAQDFFSIVRISSSPQQESRWGGAKREENGISKSCIPYAAYFTPV